MKISHRPKEAGSLDGSEGRLKRFLCYCPHCGEKVLKDYDEWKIILRQLSDKSMLDKNVSILSIWRRGVFQSLTSMKFKRIKLVDVRNNIAPEGNLISSQR
jgi:hypothetical protein